MYSNVGKNIRNNERLQCCKKVKTMLEVLYSAPCSVVNQSFFPVPDLFIPDPQKNEITFLFN